MSTEGIGAGLAEGVRMGGQFLLAGMQMKQRKDLAQKALDADVEWKRAWAGLGPSYEDEEAALAQQAASPSTMPTTPSLKTIETPGPMGIPNVRFDAGRQLQPQASVPTPRPPTPAPGAQSILPMSMGYMARPPRMRKQYY